MYYKTDTDLTMEQVSSSVSPEGNENSGYIKTIIILYIPKGVSSNDRQNQTLLLIVYD